jgi:VWFA-related protein
MTQKLLVLVILALPLLGQTQQQPTFKATTDLVLIDAVVVDQQGRHVRGLKASDFTLLDRGKRQTVATFEEVEHERVPAAVAARRVATPPAASDVASNQAGADDRLIVMVIDDLHLYKQRTDRAKGIARDVVARLGAGASMAVLFTSGDRSTEVTENRRQLTDAIDQLTGRKPYPRPSFGLEPRDTDPVGGIQNFYDNLSTVRTLREAARLLKAGNSARKAFVLLSEWIPQDLSGLFQAMAPAGRVEGGEDYAAGRLEESMKVSRTFATLDYELVDMMDTMRRSNVVVYAIDPRGAVSNQQLLRECHPPLDNPIDDPCLPQGKLPDWFAWVRQAQHGLEIAAAASGGFAITNTDDFTGGIDRILDDVDHYYLLGFYPADPDRKGYRRVEVRVNRPDVTLRYRQGYEAGPPRDTEKTDADPLLALTSAIVPKSALPLRLAAIPMTSAAADRTSSAPPAGTVRVAVALEVSVPVARVTGRDGLVSDKIRYTVIAASLRDGNAAAQFTNTADISSTKAVAVRSNAFVSYQLPVEFALRPGRYQIRAGVISQGMQESGSVYTTIDVPNVRPTDPSMSALVLGYMNDPRLPITTSSGAKSPLPFTPTLAREFRATETLRLYFEIASAALGRGDVARVTVEILDADGRAVKAWRPTPVPGQRTVVDLPLPLEGLAPGAYTLRAAIIAAQRVTKELGIVIR